jgi:hypothetical protein
VVLENELSRYPINYRDVQGEIHKMKADLDNLVDRAMMLKKSIFLLIFKRL